MIDRTERNGFEIVRLAHGKVSALDLELAEALDATLAEVERGPARGVVLTGTGGVFCAGVDLFRVLDGGAAYVDVFLPALEGAFRRVFGLSKPSVAALNGHAIAGGCVLAAACDLRVMARGPGKVGVPELAVGVPFPYLALEIMRSALPAQHFPTAIYRGKTYGPEEALRRGFVDELVDEGEVVDRALALVAELAAVPAPAFVLTKRAARADTLQRVERDGPEVDAGVRRLWKEERTYDAIRDYLRRTLGKDR